jgi:hypothetical protein
MEMWNEPINDSVWDPVMCKMPAHNKINFSSNLIFHLIYGQHIVNTALITVFMWDVAQGKC